jgi:ABC-type lipoprotein export system ATPase subunit
MIKFKNVSKNYGETQVLKDINLEIGDKQSFAILGSSGSGKSTLLYLLGALESPSEGQVYIQSQKISEMKDSELALFRNQNIGFMFQFHFLLSSMNCIDNILLPVKIANKSLDEYQELAMMLSKYLSIDHCLKKYPYQISGGEQQRVNLIRSLIMRPKILLCDEPTGNLDSKNSEKVISLLKDLSTEFGASLIIVTHDLKIASEFPNKITIEDGRLIG